jgi:hypothetical protein
MNRESKDDKQLENPTIRGEAIYSGVFLLKFRYKASTLFLAQGVLLRNCKLDLILGSLLKHLILMILPISSHP